ncbi:MAG: hypothetical protein IKG55_05215, partial [Solobacterium sp.]|nr:hypothetical protein [Solobacterium sp.]
MMHNTKKFAGLLLACMTAMSQIVPVHAEEPDDFDETDRPVLENTTDVSRMPGYTEAELSDVYGQNDTANAEEIDSMFSDEAMEAFIQKMDETLSYEPSEQEDLSSILQKKETFIQGGGVQAYLEDKDLVRGSEIGLCNNRTDKVRILGTEANASSWIYIVDKDAMVFIVKDENENGIPNAVVTITWTDDEGKRIVDSIVASDGGAPGVASFTGMPESFHGIVDIQAEGYRAVTIFDRNMGAGEHYIYQLKKAEENDLYIRGADLSGKDLVNEETEIVLMNSDTEDLDLRVLVTKRGNESFPSSIDLYSENRERTVYTLSNTSVYDVSSDTRIYSAKKRWVEQSADLFKEDDLASVKFKDRKFVFEHMSFVNTAAKPGLAASQMPMTTKPMDGKVTDRLSGSGVLDLTAEILQVPVQIGVFPNGDCVIVASYDITKLDPNTQYKYSSLFEKAWNPKTLKNAEDCLEIFEKSFWENAKYVKDGKKKLESADKVGFLANKNYNFAMNFSLYLKANHNKETNDCYGSGGIMFSGSLSGGVTEYFLFMAGPIVIPAYIGFEVGFAINTSLNINFGVNQPPVAEASDVKWAYAAGGSEEVSARIETLVSFSVFGGVGIKGVLGASATGYVNFDIATVLGKGKGNIFTDEPHSFIDVLYGLKFHYYLLFFTGQITLECVNGAKRLWDSRGEHDLIAEEISEIVFTDLSLRDCADRLIPLLSEGSGDTAYTIENNPAVSAGKGIINVDAKTYPDAQIQFAAAKNRTALFRIVSDGEKTKLVYQLQDPVTGNLEETVYEVQLPDERSVTEFVAVANKTDDDQPEYCDNAYIGAILADNTISAMADRARTTDVAAIVVNLAEHKTIRSEIVSDQSEVYKSNYYYSAPLPAGAEDYCAVAYTASYIRDLQTDTELLEALASPSQNFLAAYTNEKPDEHVTVGLGYGKVYSTGVIAPYEPSFWMVDQIHSTDKTLSIEGIAANGYYSYDDPRCRTIVDISDHPAEDFDYSNIISNWHFLNGRNYFIVTD